MKQYHDLLKYILENGQQKTDRTGTGTISVFGYQARFDLNDGFPAVTTKKLYFKGVVHELLWMLLGKTNIKYLVDNNVNIWNDDAYRHYCSEMKKQNATPMSKENFISSIKNMPDECEDWGIDFVDENKTYGVPMGDLGPIYGAQWRTWINNTGKIIDQIDVLINGLKNNPDSRRHILSAWNVAELESMSLPPCHTMAQFYVGNDKKLSCQLYQRSCDVFLGGPFNIASYALLTCMLAQVCGLEAGDFVHTFGDAHIYNNHIEQVKEQLTKKPYDLPKLWLNPEIKNINDFKYEDIKLIDYKSHETIKAPLSVGT